MDLVSSIPAIDVLRWGRIARVLRVIRILRGVWSFRRLSVHLLQRRAEAAFTAVALISILLVILASVAILQVETAETSNIKTAGDALWWSYTTITTVGYGDRYPVTSEGRIIAAALMTAGVGLFGTFTGFVASWFMAAPNRQQAASSESST